MFKLKCFHCKGIISASIENIGYYMACPHCKNEMLIKENELSAGIVANGIGPENFSSGSLAGTMATGLLTIIAYAIFYGAIYTLCSKSSIIFRMLATGWVPYAVMFLSFWAVGMLIQKGVSIRKQAGCLSVNYLPEDTALETEDEISKTCETIMHKAKENGDNMLAPQIVTVLNRFKLIKSLRDAENVWREASDKAYSEAESSYGLFRVIVWAVPILGFIGTVQGVSSSVGSLSAVLGKDVEEISQITAALTNVTKDLAFAFDTTLIALIMTVIIVVLMSIVENLEFKTLDRIEKYGIKKLLPMLAVKAAKYRKWNSTGRSDH